MDGYVGDQYSEKVCRQTTRRVLVETAKWKYFITYCNFIADSCKLQTLRAIRQVRNNLLATSLTRKNSCKASNHSLWLYQHEQTNNRTVKSKTICKLWLNNTYTNIHWRKLLSHNLSLKSSNILTNKTKDVLDWKRKKITISWKNV